MGTTAVAVDVNQCASLMLSLMAACDDQGIPTNPSAPTCELMVPRMQEALFPMLHAWPYQEDIATILHTITVDARARGVWTNDTDLTDVPSDAGDQGSPTRLIWSPWLYNNYFRVEYLATQGRWVLDSHPYGNASSNTTQDD